MYEKCDKDKKILAFFFIYLKLQLYTQSHNNVNNQQTNDWLTNKL